MLHDVNRTHVASSETHGGGMLIDEDVHLGDLIIQYTGERISMETYNARDARLQQQGKINDYMLRLPDSGNHAHYTLVSVGHLPSCSARRLSSRIALRWESEGLECGRRKQCVDDCKHHTRWTGDRSDGRGATPSVVRVLGETRT